MNVILQRSGNCFGFQFGDSMPVIFNNSQQGYLSQPDEFLTEQCSDANNARMYIFHGFSTNSTFARSKSNVNLYVHFRLCDHHEERVS